MYKNIIDPKCLAYSVVALNETIKYRTCSSKASMQKILYCLFLLYQAAHGIL